MSRVIIVSRQFPVYHPSAGKPTYFPLKAWLSIMSLKTIPYKNIIEMIQDLNGGSYDMNQLKEFVLDCASPEEVQPKYHTIRKGKKWKTGDKGSLRVWIGKPYRSKQVIIAPDLEMVIKDIEIDANGEIIIDGVFFPHADILAMFDGLTEREFDCWFNKLPFSGQILCWNNSNLPY